MGVLAPRFVHAGQHQRKFFGLHVWVGVNFDPSEVRAASGANLGRPLFLVNWSERLACAITELSVRY